VPPVHDLQIFCFVLIVDKPCKLLSNCQCSASTWVIQQDWAGQRDDCDGAGGSMSQWRVTDRDAGAAAAGKIHAAARRRQVYVLCMHMRKEAPWAGGGRAIMIICC
jgi:hypothetical protein